MKDMLGVFLSLRRDEWMPDDNYGRIEVEISHVAKELITDGCGFLQAQSLAKPRCCPALCPSVLAAGPFMGARDWWRAVPLQEAISTSGVKRFQGTHHTKACKGRGGTSAGTVPWPPVLTAQQSKSHLTPRSLYYLREWLCKGLGTSWLCQPPWHRPLREESSTSLLPRADILQELSVYSLRQGLSLGPGAHW